MVDNRLTLNVRCLGMKNTSTIQKIFAALSIIAILVAILIRHDVGIFRLGGDYLSLAISVSAISVIIAGLVSILNRK